MTRDHSTRFLRRRATAAIASVLAGAAAPAWAYDFNLGGEVEGKVNAVFTAGTAIRADSPDPAVYGTLSAARVGVAPGQLGGNSGGSNLNFERGSPISTVVKGLVDVELKRNDAGIFVRGVAWYDFALNNYDRPYGNTPNSFAQNAPLSDTGFAQDAKFQNAEVTDAFVFGKLPLEQYGTLDVRVGRQVVTWGVSQFIAGGINVVNGVNLPATLRPGALPEEGRVPVAMVYANFASTQSWGIDGWYQFEYRSGVLNGCGTFFAIPNYAPPGCNFVNVLGGQGVTDPVALATGLYPKRLGDLEASDAGQWGVSARYRAESIATEFRVYATNFHSRAPFLGITNANVNGTYGTFNPNNLTNPAANTRLTSPNGLKYQMIFPEDVKLFGVSVNSTPAPGLRIFGEASYRPNQPLGINASDLIAAFLTRAPLSALNLAKNTNAIAPGGTFEGWDRYGITNASIGASQVFPKALWADRVILSGEVGFSHVHGLPNPGQLRYGRSDDYGQAKVNGGAPCVDNTAAQKSCAQEGFITPNAWGYRLRAAAVYPNALFGATLTPAILFGMDVSGYSYGGVFLDGRWLVRPSVRADWSGGKYFAEVQYWGTGGGSYNTFVDRDMFVMYAGLRF